MTTDRNKYRTGRHVVFSLQAHIVLVTKYRRGAITDRVREEIIEASKEVGDRLDFTIIEADGEDDHIHLIIDYPPKIALSRIIMVLKTNTSRRVREKNFPEVENALWGNHFWSPSYFACSTGGASLDKVRKYVQNQRKEPKGPGRPST